MQMYVTNVTDVDNVNNVRYRENGKATARNCQTCKKVCDKPRRLPECGHVFCKRCLKEYFSTLTTWTDDHDHFPCPKCGRNVSKPNLPVSQWPKFFNANQTSQFYTTECDDISKSEDDITETRSVISRPGGSTRSTARSTLRSLHRTAVMYAIYDCVERFDSRISSDTHDCLYFGGDIMPNGDILLADWLNCSVKMFKPSGQFVCHVKLEKAPLDVTAVRDDMIVVSFGSTNRQILFLSYVPSRNVLYALGYTKIRNYLYSTTKCGDSCLGITERGGTVSLVKIDIDKKRGPRDALMCNVNFKIDRKLSPDSGIFYNHNDGRLYITHRRQLLCFSKDMQLIFSKSYNSNGDDLYPLGTVTCDNKGSIYVSSDHSILRINTDGGLVTTVPIHVDPYYIILRKDQSKLALVGKQDDVMFCNMVFEK